MQVAVRGKQELRQSAERMLDWACRALGLMHDEAQAHLVLEMALCGKYSAIDIAMHTEGKTFLSHPHCRSLIDQWFRGASGSSSLTIPSDLSTWRLVLYILLPFLNPDIWRAARAAADDPAEAVEVFGMLVAYA